MKTKSKSNQLTASEEFIVKFWIKDDQNLTRQGEESVFLYSKNKHDVARKMVVKKYLKLGKKIEVISVTYQ
jgi:hypothetical protein